MLGDDGDVRNGSNSGGDDHAAAAAAAAVPAAAAAVLSVLWAFLPRVSFPRHTIVPL